MKRFLILAPIVFILSFALGFIGYGFIFSDSPIEPQQKTSWTIETLKEHYDQRFDALQLAITKAETFAKEKFENTNEWRKSYDDLVRGYMTRLEQVGTDKAQDDRIKRIEDDIKKIENMKQGGNIVWAYVLSAVSMIIAFISISIKMRNRDIK